MRTEKGQTPNQLFVAGSLRLRHSGEAAVDFFETVSEDYGIEEGIAPDGEESVTVPPIRQLTEEQSTVLLETVNPLADSDDYGISLYTRTLQVLASFNFGT